MPLSLLDRPHTEQQEAAVVAGLAREVAVVAASEEAWPLSRPLLRRGGGGGGARGRSGEMSEEH